ncbi:terpenoid cyclases/Protein prenyltransferase [Laetiporus sulphureus 93-53]|uniref:Terpenoid cyclases/Protein prenyltransferase n=1 Tax=Laetiporus sulphureus 93-53 TaxID=1314785 RepID=A0A165HTI1_9APHY|nr:terpenoid cyclases/Protein prenyltransferase [Laetiporus sulphureus 93-53]KZT12168.1 terpenoid cyclases/Protein prenyltransferase [Laetiporus sulphureus 93-53]
MADCALPPIGKMGHFMHNKLCLSGLPFSQVEVDSSRIAIVFYCLGSMDLLNILESKSTPSERDRWRKWLWEQQSRGRYGTGFKPSPYMTLEDDSEEEYSDYDTPHLIMTYTALLSLAILRDDFSQLDRPGLLSFIRACQREDGSFSALPNYGESDLRTVYCAFVISSLLDDWSGMDLDKAIQYIRRCMSYEGGYCQTPFGEALGGTTYCALAALQMAPSTPASPRECRVMPAEKARTVRWLVQNQTSSGGFRGRTGKAADACYCFWCGASLNILGAGDLVDSVALASFLAQCQFKYGGISKAPGERSDPYHTYLSLAAIALYTPPSADATWEFPALDVLWNATSDTSKWARRHVPAS